MGVNEAKAVMTPGEEVKAELREMEQEELKDRRREEFRPLAARANYLAQDRGDTQFATKEICRDMAKPTLGGWRRLKRLAGYLRGRPRVVQRYAWQEE